MLNRIYLDNYRCFSNFEMRPSRINLLLGENGSGKSSILEAIAAIAFLVRGGKEVAEVFPSSSLTRWDSRQSQRFELDLELDSQRFRYVLQIRHEAETGKIEIQDERVTLAGKTLFAYSAGTVHLHTNDGEETGSVPFRSNRSFLAEMDSRPENAELMRFLSYLNRTRVLRLVPSSFRSVTHEESPHLEHDGANFASWYRHVSQEYSGELHRLFSNLRQVIPGFQSLVLSGAGNQGRTRDLAVRIDGPTNPAESYMVTFRELSDGQRILVVLYTLLLDLRTRGAGLVLFDEPENYVSLREIQPWLVELDDALGDEGQLLLISHHPEVVDYLAAETPLWFQRDGDGPVRVADADFALSDGLKASEQIARGLLDGQ